MAEHTPRRVERGIASSPYRYQCTCGYRTRWRAYPGHAARDYEAHRKAMEA